MEIKIIEITTNEDLYAQEIDVRYEMLRKPLGQGRDTVTFTFETSPESLHLVCLDGTKVIGCVLFYPKG